ncbi:hypothetical protein GIB67_007648 [Kingdonia uniflora]|uniref:DUF674 family protein n=1 Tax=Kingdonia uniflora TaxID=39325 RepID=A0A7J7N1L8_9MAGN|nr:hypothetical protein GIB67_007648 [Kingdonia uniflora]
MATEEGKTISLNVLVDKQRNRVVFVESNNDFIDILLSFLTIPVGTVLRLARKQKQPCGIGCMDNLYQSLEDFDSELFEKESLRHMLLRPENLAGALCKRLKINIDDTELTKYYVCPQLTIDTYYSRQHASSLLSISNNEQCSCGELMSLPINLSDEKVEDGNIEDRGVFVNALKGISFTVTDDIQILPFSTETSFAHLNALGIKRMNELDEKTINVGVEEIISILRHSFLSKIPLTEVLLWKSAHEIPQISPFQSKYTAQSKSEDTANAESTKKTVTIIFCKSQNKILYAEAGEDFVEFLFSLLTLPLGSVVKLLDQNPSLGCISNLYKTVEGTGTTLARHVKTAERHRYSLRCLPLISVARANF